MCVFGVGDDMVVDGSAVVLHMWCWRLQCCWGLCRCVVCGDTVLMLRVLVVFVVLLSLRDVVCVIAGVYVVVL